MIKNNDQPDNLSEPSAAMCWDRSWSGFRWWLVGREESTNQIWDRINQSGGKRARPQTEPGFHYFQARVNAQTLQ